jgi:MAF protein
MSSMPPLILASTSSYRRALLQRLGLPFACVAPGVDEQALDDEEPTALAARLARAKATAVAVWHPDAWVIGSDQVCSCDGRIHGKPGSLTRARAQLTAFSGREVAFHTAFTLLRSGATAREALDHTRVRFRTLEAADIERYLQREPALDCAGSFMAEGLGICLFRGIESQDPTALPGLPLIALAGALREVGYALP